MILKPFLKEKQRKLKYYEMCINLIICFIVYTNCFVKNKIFKLRIWQTLYLTNLNNLKAIMYLYYEGRGVKMSTWHPLEDGPNLGTASL